MSDRDPDLARLVEAVKELADQTRHTFGCPVSEPFTRDGRPPEAEPTCTCGLAELLSEVRRAASEPVVGPEPLRAAARELLDRGRHHGCRANVTQPASGERGYAPRCTCGREEAEEKVRPLLDVH